MPEPLHPLARMVTIKSGSFWFFIGALIILYSVNKFITPDFSNHLKYQQNNFFIVICAFGILLLNLFALKIKLKRSRRRYNLFCWFIEILAVIIIAINIFI